MKTVPEPCSPQDRWLMKHAPRTWQDMYQGLNADPLNTLVGFLRRWDLSQNLLAIGPKATGKTRAARVYGARRCCANWRNDPINPCGACKWCTLILSGDSDFGTGTHELNCARKGWLDALAQVLDGGGGYGPVRNGNPLSLPHVVIFDEFGTAPLSLQEKVLKDIEDRPLQFIFVAMEPDRVHKAVASRCLRLDFRPPTRAQFSAWYTRLLRREGITWDAGVPDLMFALCAADIRTSMNKGQLLAERARHWGVRDVLELFGHAHDALDLRGWY